VLQRVVLHRAGPWEYRVRVGGRSRRDHSLGQEGLDDLFKAAAGSVAGARSACVGRCVRLCGAIGRDGG
jgi:hypothetical protein